MKTTIELPDVKFRETTALAAARGVTSRQLFTEALGEQLRRWTRGERADDADPPWMAGFGALSDPSDESRRVLGLIGG